MKTSEANIEITRKFSEISSVSVIMPTWRQPDDEILSVSIPLLGLKTTARNIDDADVAIQEAIKCFLIACERFGQGAEKELEAIGWSLLSKENGTSLLNYSIEQTQTSIILEQIMETGEQYAEHDLVLS